MKDMKDKIDRYCFNPANHYQQAHNTCKYAYKAGALDILEQVRKLFVEDHLNWKGMVSAIDELKDEIELADILREDN